ncbi:MAG: hypothetical protein R3C99_28205 [Pirellulaceae bacterium]
MATCGFCLICGILIGGGRVRAASPITAIAFTPSGDGVVIGSQQGVELLGWPELGRQRHWPLGAMQVHDLAFAPHGKQLAIAGGDPAETGKLQVLDWPAADDKTPRTISSAHKDVIYRVAWREDGNALATASGDAKVLIVHHADGLQERGFQEVMGEPLEFAGHASDVFGVAFLAGGKLVTGGNDGSLRLWDTDTRQAIRTLTNHTDAIRAVSVRPGDAKLPVVATAGADRTVRFWQPTIGRLMRFARLPSSPLDLVWTMDGRQVLAACADGRLRMIDWQTTEVTGDWPLWNDWAYCVAIHPTEPIAVVGGANGELKRVPIGSP